MAVDPLNRRGLVVQDPHAVRSLLRRIAQYLRRYVRDTSAMRELSQSASAEIFRRLREQPRGSTQQLERWTSYSAVNALRRALRRQRAEVVAFQSELHGQPESDPDDVLAARHQLERIDKLLADLRPRDQHALVAKTLGFTDTEVAAQLDTTPDAIRSTVSRTRSGLRLSLTQDELRAAVRQIVREAAEHGRLSIRRGESSSA